MAKSITPPDKLLGGDSTNWKNWMSELSPTTCKDCVKLHGKIYPIEEFVPLPLHINGKCQVVPMRTKIAGTATNMGQNGVDAYLLKNGRLPGYYVLKKDAYKAKWKQKGNTLDIVLSGKMIGGDLYYNNENRLPPAPNRMWYEADFDYVSGERDGNRVFYSNDGLIFVSYDHGKTFYELTK